MDLLIFLCFLHFVSGEPPSEIIIRDPKDLNFLEWLFGIKQNITTTLFLPQNQRNFTAGGNVTIASDQALRELHNSTTTLVSASRNGKQMFPGGYFQYPMYAWPMSMHPALMTHLKYMPTRRPMLNVYAEAEPNSFEVDAGVEGSEELEEELQLKRIPIGSSEESHNQVVIQLEPASSSYEDGSSIEDYASSREVSRENSDFDSYEFNIGKNFKKKRDLGSVTSQSRPSKEQNCAEQMCLHVDRRRPSSRGNIGDANVAEQADNTSRPLTQNATVSGAVAAVSEIEAANETATSSSSVAVSGDNMLPSVQIPVEENSSRPISATTASADASSDLNSSPMSVASSYTPSQAPPPETSTLPTEPSHDTVMSENQNGTISNSSLPDSTNSTEEEPIPAMPTISAILNCQCGVQTVAGGVVGSAFIRVNLNPWVVQVNARSKHLCSGSLINDRYILTAASCIDMHKSKTIRVIVGIQGKRPHTHRVTKVAIHPKYDPSTFANNIALLRFSESKKHSRDSIPICLPLGNLTLLRSTAHLVTWVDAKGYGHGGRFRSTRRLQLLQTEVELVKDTDCQGKVNDALEGVVISNGTICASPPPQKKCGGDAGGVLQAYAGEYSFEQVGTVSMSVGCRANGLPGIYTDIRQYLRWILFQTQDAHYCREPNAGSFTDTESNGF